MYTIFSIAFLNNRLLGTEHIKALYIPILFISKLSFTNYLYKIPGLSNISVYLFLQNTKYINIKKIITGILFFIMIFLFTIVFKNTIIYTIPWILCILYIVITIKKKYSNFDIIFISTWLAQAIGSVLYGLLNGFLSYKSYVCLLPISILERSLFIAISTILLYTIKLFDMQLIKILKIIFKKQLTIKLKL